MATKVKPSRINITWTPASWDLPIYTSADSLIWWKLHADINSSTYVITIWLRDGWWNTIWTDQTIDLPLESVVVSWSYDEDTKEVVLVLESGSEIRFSVADLIDWLQSEITATNKLSSDLVDDTNNTNKFVTATDICNWNAKADICDIPTDNCQLTNWCWYTTCTWTLVPADIQNLAQCCDIPTDNCQLANWCWYTTCTGTLVPSDLNCYAKCCDIPTDNCELANSCGYTTCTGTLVPSDLNCYAKCCDIPTDNCELANGCWYTTCTWTLVPADLNWYAKTCDIPTDNCELANWCWYTTCTWTVTNADLCCYTQCCDMPNMSCYQQIACIKCDLNNPDNNHYPTTKAVADAMSCLWWWDMLKATYDPCNCNADAFDYCNFHNTPTIPTNNCQLANGCGYTTCTWTLQACDIANLAQCCDIPTNNCQLTNWCWYTTCTWTLSSCADVISALWYTPYSSSNPSGYTSCTGTLVPSDLNNYAKCCDIPTDNCQLSNWCGYTTCTGTLNWWDLKTVNGNCLVGSWDICIQAWVASVNWCTWAVCLTIPTDNCELSNGCWYTTCTGTLQSCDIATINWCCLTMWGNICIQWWWSTWMYVDYVIVWWWWGWWAWVGYNPWWWGGWWQVKEFYWALVMQWSCCAIVWNWGTWWTNNVWGNWWNSSFLWVVANWWCWWKWWNDNYMITWWTSWTWAVWWYALSSIWWWGWGWAWWFWQNSVYFSSCYGWWWGWAWLYSSIMQCFFWWWWWGWSYESGTTWYWWIWWWWNWTAASAQWTQWTTNTWWWGWWWNHVYKNWFSWGSGVVIVRYKTDWWCWINCATWWTVFCCNWYTYHCFTSNWTFTIVS